MQPALSVIIACRNAEETLGAQLTALSTQTCDVPWDVIVVDNGSTDGTVALAESYSDQLPALRVVTATERAGAGYARNAGAEHTHAPWLAFCDADDEVAPGWVAAMASGLRRHQFIAGRFDAHLLNPPAVLRTRSLQQDHELQHSPFGPDLPHAGGGNLGVHRSVFLAVDGFDPEVGCLEDTDLCWRIQLSGVPLVWWPEAVLHVRLRSSFRGMWRQGRAYGAAAAMLDHRYPRRPQISVVRSGTATSPTPSAPSPAAVPAPQNSDRKVPLTQKVARFAQSQQSLGGLLWSLGWHVGHRRWQAPAGQPQHAVPVELSQRRAG